MWQEGWDSRGSGWSLCEKGKLWGDVAGRMFPSWDIYRPNNLNSLTNVATGYATFCCNSWRAKGQNYLTSSLQVIYSVKASRAARTAKWCLILLSHNKKIQLTINSSTFLFFLGLPSPPNCWSEKSMHHHRPQTVVAPPKFEQNWQRCWILKPALSTR